MDKKNLSLLISLILGIVFTGCSDSDNEFSSADPPKVSTSSTENSPKKVVVPESKTLTAEQIAGGYASDDAELPIRYVYFEKEGDALVRKMVVVKNEEAEGMVLSGSEAMATEVKVGDELGVEKIGEGETNLYTYYVVDESTIAVKSAENKEGKEYDGILIRVSDFQSLASSSGLVDKSNPDLHILLQVSEEVKPQVSEGLCQKYLYASCEEWFEDFKKVASEKNDEAEEVAEKALEDTSEMADAVGEKIEYTVNTLMEESKKAAEGLDEDLSVEGLSTEEEKIIYFFEKTWDDKVVANIVDQFETDFHGFMVLEDESVSSSEKISVLVPTCARRPTQNELDDLRTDSQWNPFSKISFSPIKYTVPILYYRGNAEGKPRVEVDQKAFSVMLSEFSLNKSWTVNESPRVDVATDQGGSALSDSILSEVEESLKKIGFCPVEG